jgi:hypothetical protein
MVMAGWNHRGILSVKRKRSNPKEFIALDLAAHQ